MRAHKQVKTKHQEQTGIKGSKTSNLYEIKNYLSPEIPGEDDISLNAHIRNMNTQASKPEAKRDQTLIRLLMEKTFPAKSVFLTPLRSLLRTTLPLSGVKMWLLWGVKSGSSGDTQKVSNTQYTPKESNFYSLRVSFWLLWGVSWEPTFWSLFRCHFDTNFFFSVYNFKIL